MSDFTISVDFDAREVLQGFQRLEQEAKSSGQSVGKSLAEGIQGFSSKSIAALQQELSRLQQQQIKIDVDSKEFTATGKQIEAVQNQLNEIQRKQVSIGVNDRSITALQTKLQDLQRQQVRVDVDSSEFVDLQREIDKTQAEILEVERKKILINADPNSVVALNAKLQGLQDELNKVAIGSQRFRELQAEIKDTQKELDKAGQSVGGFNLLDRAVEGIAFSLANTLTNAAGAALQALGSIPQEVQKFDNAKAAVRTLGVNAEDLGDKLLELSRSTNSNVSAVDLLKASYDVASSGFASATDATNVLAAAQDGAVGGFTDINTVADAATSVLNAYGLSSDKARELVDGFIQTQNDGKITVGEYAGEIGRIAPVAAASGVSIGELNAAISAATAQGVPVSSTFAGLRQAISSILKPSKEASEYAQTLGIDFSASGLKAKGFGGFMEDVARKTGGSAEAIIRLTGSVEAQAAIQPLVNDQLQKYNQFLGNQAKSAGVASDAAKEATSTVEGSLKRLSNTFSNLSVQALQGVTPAVTAVINAFNNALNAVVALPGPVKALGLALAGLTTTYVTAKLAVIAFNSEAVGGKLKGAIDGVKALAASLRSEFIKDLATAKAAWVAFTTSVKTGELQRQVAALATKFGPLALAIGGVTAAFISYNASTRDSQSIAKTAAAGQDQLTKALAAAGIKTGQLTTLGGPFARAWQNSSGAVENFLGFLRGIPGVGNLVAAAIKPLATAIGGLVKGFKDLVDNANATQGLENAAVALGNLQTQSTAAQNAAAKLFDELKKAGGPPNTQQVQQINATIAALQAASTQANALKEKYTQLAAAARNSGNEKLAKEYEALAKAAGQDAKLSETRLQQLNSLVPATQRQAEATDGLAQSTEEQTKALKERAEAEAELNKLIGAAPVRRLDAQLAVGQQLLSLSQSIGQVEQSRYNITKSALNFELQQAEKRGASESQLKSIREQIAANDRSALQARYTSLLNEQKLQQALLKLNQEKARTEANLSVLEQRGKLLEAQAKLKDAEAKGDAAAIGAARAQVDLQSAILGVQQSKVNVLNQTQPLERAALSYQQQAARNGLQAEAAAVGYRFAVDGSIQPVNALAQLQGRVATVSATSANEQARYYNLAQQSGFAISRTSDGTMVLGREQGDVNRAVYEMNRQLGGAGRLYGDAADGAYDTADASGDISRELSDAEGAGEGVAGSFTQSGDKAPRVAQGSRDFAGWLSKAKGFGENIADLSLDQQMALVASETDSAAGAAQTFYNWLKQASDLPGARWSGGPVEAGGEYKINELGQEAFLSAGRLSLINAPANSIWRAPSDGVVIPAGVTAQLQARAAVATVGGGQPGVAELAIEVGKLRQEVGNLARRDWSVKVTQRTGPTGSQVMRTLLS